MCLEIVKEDPTQFPPPRRALPPAPEEPKVPWPDKDGNPTDGSLRDMAIDIMKFIARRDGKGEVYIVWVAELPFRGVIRQMLKELAFDLDTDGLDFEVCPASLPDGSGLLVFTQAGSQKLRAAIGDHVTPDHSAT
jgi:hypothetical protein